MYYKTSSRFEFYRLYVKVGNVSCSESLEAIPFHYGKLLAQALSCGSSTTTTLSAVGP
jgi:hypothetical protein